MPPTTRGATGQPPAIMGGGSAPATDIRGTDLATLWPADPGCCGAPAGGLGRRTGGMEPARHLGTVYLCSADKAKNKCYKKLGQMINGCSEIA